MSYIPLFYIYLYYSVRNTHLLYCYSQLDSRKVTFIFIYILKPIKGEMSIDGRKSFHFSHIEIVCEINHELPQGEAPGAGSQEVGERQEHQRRQ